MSASIWFHPRGGRTIEEIDLGCSFTDVDEFPVVSEAVAQSMSGRRTRVVFSGTWGCDYEISLMRPDYDVIRKLEALQSHLVNGGLCTLAEDNSRTLGGFVLDEPGPQSTELRWYANLWGSYGGFTAGNGDVLVLRGPSPEAVREEVEVASSGVSTSATLSAAPLNTWRGYPWVFVRNKGFWPVLRLRTGVRKILTTNHRVTWRLQLQMEEPPHAYDALSRNPGDSLQPDDATFSLDDTVAGVPGRSSQVANAPWGDPQRPGRTAPGGRGSFFPF